MSNMQGPHQGQQVYRLGKELTDAKTAMILVHGRGATAPSILELANLLSRPDMIHLAPQAADNTWYAYSFLAPMEQNEPGLSSGLQRIADLVTEIERAGIPTDKIMIGGFSQGACLASEFVARHAKRYGGLLVFSGGLIGPPGTAREYEGTFDGMPVFLGCSDVDSHIPEERIHETADVFAQMEAEVNKRIYPGMAHTIIQDELDQANLIVERL